VDEFKRIISMDKKIVFIFMLLFISQEFIKAQKIGVEVQASANYPLIPTYTRSIYPYKWVPIANVSGIITVDNSTKFRENYRDNIGGKLGLNVAFDLKKNFFLRTGIGLNFISFKREFKYVDLAEPQSGGFGTYTIPDPGIHSLDIGKTYLLYTDIPVSAGYRFLKKKLIVNLGFTVSLLTYSEQYIIDPYSELHGLNERMIYDDTGLGLSNLSFSVNAELAYQIKNKFSIFMRYSYQLSSIYDKNFQYVGTPRYNLFELGAGYRIY
jgi:Outer membrane protein beta-barrel domain